MRFNIGEQNEPPTNFASNIGRHRSTHSAQISSVMFNLEKLAMCSDSLTLCCKTSGKLCLTPSGERIQPCLALRCKFAKISRCLHWVSCTFFVSWLELLKLTTDECTISQMPIVCTWDMENTYSINSSVWQQTTIFSWCTMWVVIITMPHSGWILHLSLQ